MSHIIVTGSVAYDRIMDFQDRFREHILPDQIHVLNVSFILDKLEENFGGTAGNIAYNLALVGLTPKIVSAVGSDFDRYGAHLEAHGIDTSSIKRIEGAYTAVANMITDLDDNQISAFYPGALAHGSQVPITNDIARDAALVIVSPSSKQEMALRCMEARKLKIPYCFDPGQQMTTLSPEELSHCSSDAAIVIFNDYEWQLFRSKTSHELDDLTQRGVVVVVTQGAQGSIIYTKEKDYRIAPAQAGEVFDPTGAGDAYRAGIVLGFVHKWDWHQAGHLASTVASYAVEQYGTQRHAPSIAQINQRYEDNFNEKSPLAA